MSYHRPEPLTQEQKAIAFDILQEFYYGDLYEMAVARAVEVVAKSDNTKEEQKNEKTSNGLKAGDWVCNLYHVGKVRSAYSDDDLIDVILYNREGKRIGRESPAMGGPNNFEPACNAHNWRKISKPDFPMTKFSFIEDIVEFIKDEK